MLKADFIHVNGILQDIFDFRKNINVRLFVYWELIHLNW